METMRLDKVCLRFETSRSKAVDAIKQGLVSVNGKVVTKPSFLVKEIDEIEYHTPNDGYVSRGAYKLKAAFDAFGFSIKDEVCLDIGASTGGFTDICLRQKAKMVYALDVGHLQLDPRLEQDPRVISMEKCNARELEASWFDEPIEFMCMDVSFISCKTILEQVFQELSVKHFVTLIKPQFECGPSALNRNGILKNEKMAHKIVEDIRSFVFTQYEKVDVIPCPIQGRKGNQEFVLYATNRR